MNHQDTAANTPVTFSRLPVFDTRKNLWGYELVYMSADKNQTICPETGDGYTAELMSGTSLALDHTMDSQKKIVVSFSVKNILKDLPYTLPPGRTVVKITNPAGLSGSMLLLLKKLQTDGYQVMLPWIKGHETCKAAYDLADIVCLDIAAMVLPELIHVCEQAQPYKTKALANQVKNQVIFDICCQAGFTFFKGSFFKQPEDISVKKVLSGTVSRFKLMEAIETDAPDFSELAAIIQADVVISFRLLSYLNSASFGFRRKIDSIKDAITLMGWASLKNWLRVVLLSEVSENRNASELIFLSAQRGKFLEQVGVSHDFWGFEPDSLFLLGMFSLLDALLNQPMAEILKYLPLADKLKSALLMESNNEFVPLLKLAQYFEDAEFNKSDAMINQLGLDTAQVKQAYHSSIDWANKLSEMQLKK
ncbi:MAG: HDOD domain-containing protein [Proteobacteria bacterium]|nr:HDOD domain-containing protein [Pseudomonadota bacterium]MBU1388855.1 HDOD domain-containing protein [Pseudomonadota bacterium]MBU1542236.1 HDOD domain-containing protein [Pseudomonadota bacterium]MBU2480474.1 HDOD domain-containing protein [Pseudomonadota bacterium]